MYTYKFIPALLALVVMSSTLHAEASTPDAHANEVKLLGTPAQPESAERTVTVTEKTKSLNVVGGETVKFVIRDKTFAWHFDGPFSSFKLNQIAPEGMLDHVVTIYLTQNPLYFGG